MSLILGVGTDNGVTVVSPGKDGDAWQLLSQGLTGKPVSCLAPHQDGALYVGASNGTLYRTRNFETWEPLYAGIKNPSVHSVAMDPSHPDLIFCGTSPAAIFVSGDRGANFQQIESFNQVEGRDRWTNPDPPYRPRVQRLVLHPQNSQVVLAAVHCGGLYISGDHGQTWHDRSKGLGPQVQDICLHPAEPQRLYATIPTAFCRSDDLGTTWIQSNKGLAYTLCSNLVVAKEDPNVLILGCHRGKTGGISLFRSLDGGANWQLCPGSFPAGPTHHLTALVAAKGMIVAGTSGGDLIGTNDFGGMWRKLRPAMAPIRSLGVVYQK